MVVFLGLLATIAGSAFYVGMLVGRRGAGDHSIKLLCSNETLSKLAIPLQARAQEQAATTIAAPTTGAYAGSKNGTKYYTPGCAGLERIKPENRVWFQSREDATLQGYTPASC